jgi:ubiquinone/menaquinone biosynthesis C-methylase UbiE
LNGCVGFFLLQYIKDLPQGATYILIDYDLERITQLKKNLEMYYEHKNFIFLCCDFHRLPIAPMVIDVVVDLWMTRDYFESTGEVLLDKVFPVLKQNGLYTAAFHCIEQNTKSVRNMTAIEKEFLDKEKMLKKLDRFQLATIDVTNVGPFFEDNLDSVNYYGAENYQAIYAGRKR